VTRLLVHDIYKSLHIVFTNTLFQLSLELGLYIVKAAVNDAFIHQTHFIYIIYIYLYSSYSGPLVCGWNLSQQQSVKRQGHPGQVQSMPKGSETVLMIHGGTTLHLRTLYVGHSSVLPAFPSGRAQPLLQCITQQIWTADKHHWLMLCNITACIYENWHQLIKI